MGLHERGGRFFGRQRGALDLAAAERRTIAARERARVGLHDPHERGAAAARKPNARDADLVGDSGGQGESAVAIEPGRFGENSQTLPAIHADYYTRDE